MSMTLPYRKLAATVLISLAATNVAVPSASAQDISRSDLNNCSTANTEESTQIPYVSLAAAEEALEEAPLDAELISALEASEVNYEIVGPAPRALPAIAAGAVAVVAWCAKGALTSLAPSALQQAANLANDGIEPPNWVMNAIFGCAGGPVIGALTTQTMKLKFASLVLATVIKLRNFG